MFQLSRSFLERMLCYSNSFQKPRRDSLGDTEEDRMEKDISVRFESMVSSRDKQKLLKSGQVMQ